MTLTVRLDATLQAALDQYCATHGLTKTLVVQESLARYLAAAPGGGSDAPGAATHQRGQDLPISANYRAFADNGLLGAVAAGGASAEKVTVRQQALRRLNPGSSAV